MPNQRDKFESWKYLVDDFLEMAFFLNEKERGFLIEKIALRGAAQEKISSHAAFSMSGKLITLAEKETIEELWIYDARQKKVKCFKLVETPGTGRASSYRWAKSVRHRLENEKA